MKNVRLIILFSILSLFSGSFPVGLSSFKLQKYTTESNWSARKESNFRVASYQPEQGLVVKTVDTHALNVSRHMARLYYTQLFRIQFIRQQAEFRQIKANISPSKLFVPAAKYPCRPAFG
ncbi:hypothetical protein [Pedobacter heparinus]|uniref:hypothetical protein n=1 Tax=Pedobacter heparinus TaxID=984 RepID=UPI00292D99E2|nr:hypothetical protein [Pedobacter heparinus]